MEPSSFYFLIVTLLQVGVAEPQVMTVPVASPEECAVVAKDLAQTLRNHTSTADVGFLCVSATLRQNGEPKA